MRQAVNIASVQKVSATGGLADVNVGGYCRFGTFRLKAKNDAGTNPTLDVKIQTSDPATTGYSYTTEGATETKLKTGAATLVKHALTFTQSGAASVKSVALVLKKIGTLATGKKVTVEIQSNNAGAPSGTVLGTTTIDIDTEIGTAFWYVTATFSAPVDLADATVYHIVLSADYTASATNCVVVRSKTVVSGGTQQTFDGTSWTAVGTESYEAIASQYVFTDLKTFTQITSVGAQDQSVPLDSTDSVVRPYVTIGGTSSPAFYLSVDLIADGRYS